MFTNVISLGYWCGPALELRRIERRNASYPFDWLLIDFQEVIRLMNTNFDSFLCYENLAQYSTNPEYYCDIVHNVHFYHDFSQNKTLSSQFDGVKEKYNRRIARFQRATQKPTLFIRYVRDEQECVYIKDNYSQILKTIKTHCKENECCFVGNKNPTKYNLPNFFGGGDETVIDDFMDHIPGIKNFVITQSNPIPIQKNRVKEIGKKIVRKFYRMKKAYVHEKRYYPSEE